MNLQFLYSQDNLRVICQDRELRSQELHKTNDFYGQASVLKRYAGLPNWYRLKGVLEHGLPLRDCVWTLDQNALLPHFACSTKRAEIIQRCTGKQAFPIGCGYLYAMRLVKDTIGEKPRETVREGTIVFPSHCTHSLTCQFNFDEYAQRLANLPKEFQPVVVCIYWKDYLLGRHEAYLRQGMPVVSAGHMYDCDFLLRFYDICRQFRYSASNDIGTDLFQSVVSGCRFFFLTSSELSWDVPSAENDVVLEGIEARQAVEKELRRLFANPVEEITREQRAFVDEIIGTHCVKKPEQLRLLFFKAELWDKIRPLKINGQKGIQTLGPPVVQRGMARIRRLRRSLIKRLPNCVAKQSTSTAGD